MNPSLQHPLVCNVTIYKLFMNLCHMQVLQITDKTANNWYITNIFFKKLLLVVPRTALWTEILNVVPGIYRSRYRFLKVLYK